MPDPETPAQRVARRLRAARGQALLTVREVEQATGIRHSLIVKYENGDVTPPLNRLAQLARVYGLTLAALLAEQDDAMQAIVRIERGPAQGDADKPDF
jgi:transcriptional regulator with XRE-family HTH domain